jgi:hypothetical protein
MKMKMQFKTERPGKLGLNKRTVAYLALTDSQMKMMAGGNAGNYLTVPVKPDQEPTVNTSKMQSCTLGPTRPFTFPD